MHELIQLDLSGLSWKQNGHNNLTVGIWSPYEYKALAETGRLFFLIVSDRASFSERIFQQDPEAVKIELIQHLRNNYPHSYIIKEKLNADGEKSYIGDFRTMKPFLTTFRELNSAELHEFVEEFVALTECKYHSDRADFLVNVLDGDSELHYKLASRLSDIHQKAEDANDRIQELIHKLRQNTLHIMAEDLLGQLDGIKEKPEIDPEQEFNDPAAVDENIHKVLTDEDARTFGSDLAGSMRSPAESEYEDPSNDDYTTLSDESRVV